MIDAAIRLALLMLVALGVAATAAPQAPGDPDADLPADVQALLKRLPADTPEIRAELLALSERDIWRLCNHLHHPAAGDDAPVRYALHGLAVAVAEPGRRAERETFARAVLAAFLAPPYPADQQFLFEQLRLAGARRSMGALRHDLTTADACVLAATELAVMMPEDSATEALRAALPAATGRCRIAIINALADDYDADTFTLIMADAVHPDPELRLAALNYLAHTADPRVLDVLRDAAATDSRYLRGRATDLLLAYALELAAKNERKAVAHIYASLLAERTAPEDRHVRCAVLRDMPRALGAAAAEAVFAALTDADPQVRAAAAAAAVALPGLEGTEACLQRFAQATPDERAALLDVFARRGDPRAFDVACEALRDEESPVRLAAVRAVAVLGGQRAVDPLVVLLANSDDDLATAAADALARLPGAAITQQLGDAMQDLGAPARVRLLTILAQRPVADSTMGVLLDATRHEDTRVRAAAARALGVLGDANLVTDLLPLALAAESPAERAAAADALIRIGHRSSELSEITQPVADAVAGQSDEVQAALLRVLGHLGGALALDTLRAALADEDEALRRAALQAFDEWPDAGPTPRLIDFAAKTAAQKEHVLALRAAAHMLERDTRLAAGDKVDLCAAALDTARRPEEKRLFLARLGSTPDPHSILILAPYLEEPPVAQEAASALVRLADGCIPDELPTAERALHLVAQRALPASVAAERERVAQRFDEFAGYLTDWRVSGPYEQAGQAGHEIFDFAFPPEQPDASNYGWRPQPVHDDPRHAWLIDLLGSVGGDNRAAYLRTRILCEAECDARLELGSDDGVKVWLNEEMVHSNNALRGVSRGADIVPIHLRAGWNTLMLKVTNNGGGWGVCVRLRDPAGKPLPNVRVDADGAS